MLLVRVIRHQTLKHWISDWTQQGLMGSGQMRHQANFQGSEFECFGFVGDCGIIVKLRVKVADKKLVMQSIRTRLGLWRYRQAQGQNCIADKKLDMD